MRPLRRRRSREIDVLHDGDVRKTSHLMKDIGLNKDRLIPEKWSDHASYTPQQPLPCQHPETAVVESPVKRPANDLLDPPPLLPTM